MNETRPLLRVRLSAGLYRTDGELMKVGIDFVWTAELLNTKILLEVTYIGFLVLDMKMIKDAVMYNAKLTGVAKRSPS